MSLFERTLTQERDDARTTRDCYRNIIDGVASQLGAQLDWMSRDLGKEVETMRKELAAARDEATYFRLMLDRAGIRYDPGPEREKPLTHRQSIERRLNRHCDDLDCLRRDINTILECHTPPHPHCQRNTEQVRLLRGDVDRLLVRLKDTC